MATVGATVEVSSLEGVLARSTATPEPILGQPSALSAGSELTARSAHTSNEGGNGGLRARAVTPASVQASTPHVGGAFKGAWLATTVNGLAT